MSIHLRRAALLAALAMAVSALLLGTSPVAKAQDVEPAAGGSVESPTALLRLPATRDAYVAEASPGANFGSLSTLIAESRLNPLSGSMISTDLLLHFDLSQFPVGTTIESATLTLRQLTASGGGNWAVPVYRLLGPWEEPTVTWDGLPDFVTTGHVLSSPQLSDFSADVDVTRLTSDMVNFPVNFANNGILLQGVPATSTTSRTFGSRESATPPILTVQYTLPSIRVCLETIDGCKPAAGALVHNRTTGVVRTADANGYISVAGAALGNVLWARLPISSANGGTLYWTTPATSVIAASAFVGIGNSSEMRLAVRSSAPLYIQDLDLTAQWHVQAVPADATLLRNRIVSASNHLYSFTDGQFAIGRVTVRQSYDGWEGANIQLFANNTLQPKAFVGGIVPVETPDVDAGIPVSYTPGAISMGSYWNRFGTPPGSLNVFEGTTYGEAALTDDWSLALAHEFGHYLLYLFDTYTGIDGNADLNLTRICTGTAMGDVYVPDNQGFLWDPDFWTTACGATEAFARHQGRVEWQTIRAFYAWAQVPASFVPGPAAPPVPLTSVVFIAPPSAGVPAAQLFDLDYVDDERSSGEARAFLLRGGRVLEQGKPAKESTQVALTGAEIGDRLCVYDINDHAEGAENPRHQFGCEIIAAGDDRLQLTKNAAWSPEIALSQSGPQSLQIVVTQPVEGPAAPLRVRLFPEHQMGLPELTLPQAGVVFSATVVLTQPVPPLFVQLYVQEDPSLPQTRREVIVDRGTGGGGAFGPARAYGGVLVYSSDGNASYEGEGDLELLAGQSIAWQSMPGTPPLPFHKWITGQSYRLDAFPSTLVQGGTVKIRFVDETGLASVAGATAVGTDATDKAVYFWDGATWNRLATVLSVPAGSVQGTLLASAPSQGVGVYAVLGEAPGDRLRFLPLVLQP